MRDSFGDDSMPTTAEAIADDFSISREVRTQLRCAVSRWPPRRGTPADLPPSARLAGLPAPYACKAGVCATCRARLTAGQVRMLVNCGLSKEEVASGHVQTCQAVPQGDGVAVDYDA